VSKYMSFILYESYLFSSVIIIELKLLVSLSSLISFLIPVLDFSLWATSLFPLLVFLRLPYPIHPQSFVFSASPTCFFSSSRPTHAPLLLPPQPSTSRSLSTLLWESHAQSRSRPPMPAPGNASTPTPDACICLTPSAVALAPRGDAPGS
jgi:hypothetical protein